MWEILKLLPVLALLIVTNIALGMHNGIGKQQLSFDKSKLLSGLFKGFIVAGAALSLAFCAEQVDMAALGITPQLILNTAILTYAGKSLTNLAAVLGVQVKK